MAHIDYDFKLRYISPRNTFQLGNLTKEEKNEFLKYRNRAQQIFEVILAERRKAYGPNISARGLREEILANTVEWTKHIKYV
jgi:hypothetical protein